MYGQYSRAGYDGVHTLDTYHQLFIISSYSLDQDVSSEAEDSESKSNSSAFSPWQSTSDHRSIEKVANDTIVQDETPEEEDDINVDEDEDDIADHDDNDTTLIRLFTRDYL